MSKINDKHANVWIEKNSPENGLFRVSNLVGDNKLFILCSKNHRIEIKTKEECANFNDVL